MNLHSLLAACAAALVLSNATWAAPLAWVPNEGSGTLSVIDTATDRVVAEVPAGKKPRGTVISADGRILYVSDQPNDQLVMIDVASRRRIGTRHGAQSQDRRRAGGQAAMGVAIH
jgi:YVTN family beta-propeller protein